MPLMTMEEVQELQKAEWLDNIQGIVSPASNAVPDYKRILDTLEKALAVVEAASNIEDMVEVPERLGQSSQKVAYKAIEKFRESLKPFHPHPAKGGGE